MELRPYQQKLKNDLYRAWGMGYSPIALIATTGSGKTQVSGSIVRDAYLSHRRVFFIVHLDQLVEQTAKKFAQFGIDVGYIKAGYEENQDALVQICSIQTMQNRDWWRYHETDIIIFDESHITLTSKIGLDIIYNTHPNAYVCALTATPKTLTGEQLGDHVQGMVCSPTPLELQKMGYLTPLRYFVPKGPNLSEVPIANGDYEPESLKNACNTPELIAAGISEWFNLTDSSGNYLCRGKRTLAFCVDKEHAENVAHGFNYSGVPFACVTSDTPIKERKIIYEKLRTGELLGISSINVISIGFDEPSVEVGLMLRPTQSEALWLQQLGRVMRISPDTGKQYGVIIDQAGNSTRLVVPEQIQKYELSYSKEKGTRTAPMKECPICGKFHYTFATQCDCGHRWIVEKHINDNGMIEIDPQTSVPVSEVKEKFRLYRIECFVKNIPPTEAERRFAEQYGFSPLESWYKGAVLAGENYLEEQYMKYLSDQMKVLGKDVNWATREYSLERFGKVAA